MSLTGLMIKVTGDTEKIMEIYKETSTTKKYVWYCYLGNPVTKPYNKGYKNAFFIGNGKLYHTHLLEIRRGPKHNGKILQNSESEFIPQEFKSDLEIQAEIAFFLKCGIIRELNHDKALKYIFYNNNPKKDYPYIPSEARTSVCYINFKNSLKKILI